MSEPEKQLPESVRAAYVRLVGQGWGRELREASLDRAAGEFWFFSLWAFVSFTLQEQEFQRTDLEPVPHYETKVGKAADIAEMAAQLSLQNFTYMLLGTCANSDSTTSTRGS